MNDNHSPTFDLLHRAILGRKQVTCTYQGHRREICPYILGHRDGREAVLAYQFGGQGSRGPVTGNWRCLYLAEMKEAVTRDGPWHGDAAHHTTQSCVDAVYIDVNTDVPNQPGRR